MVFTDERALRIAKMLSALPEAGDAETFVAQLSDLCAGRVLVLVVDARTVGGRLAHAVLLHFARRTCTSLHTRTLDKGKMLIQTVASTFGTKIPRICTWIVNLHINKLSHDLIF